MAELEYGENEDQVTQWVTFSLDQETYGINVMNVQEVLPCAEIAPVPGAPPFVLGIINLRGNVVTVIDTRMRFGLPPLDEESKARVVVTEANDQVAGILVDSVSEVINVRSSEIDTAPSVGNDDSSRYIYGVVSRDNELLILVDVYKLLTKEEWADIASLG
ncbi:MAG: purine-binding chemotaxis protein CheW [Gammaproteobacteria bacterium]|nr:MAG: purine-binding chemotaxis protein CheW [Gammaproteobacteria bacterium]